MLAADHKPFRSRTDYGTIAARETTLTNPDALCGYILGLEVAAGICRSHIISAAEKLGPKSDAVKIDKADLYCIEREIRRHG